MSLIENIRNDIFDSINKLSENIARLGNQISKIETISKQLSGLMNGSESSSCERIQVELQLSLNRLKKSQQEIVSCMSVLSKWNNFSRSSQSGNAESAMGEKAGMNATKTAVLLCQAGEYHYESGKNNLRHAYGQLKYVEKSNRKRNSYVQKSAGDIRRRDDDEGGHLIGSRFGGSCAEDNIFPQNRHLNRSAYKALENLWLELLKNGNRVYVDIYTSATDDNMREDSIYGLYIVVSPNGTSYTEAFSFANENRHVQEEWEKTINDNDID